MPDDREEWNRMRGAVPGGHEPSLAWDGKLGPSEVAKTVARTSAGARRLPHRRSRLRSATRKERYVGGRGEW